MIQPVTVRQNNWGEIVSNVISTQVDDLSDITSMKKIINNEITNRLRSAAKCYLTYSKHPGDYLLDNKDDIEFIIFGVAYW